MKPDVLRSTAGKRLSSVVGVARRMKLRPAASAGRHSSSSSSGGRAPTIRPAAPAGVAGGGEGDELEAGGGRGQAHRVALLGGQVPHNKAVVPRRDGVGEEALDA